MKRIIPGIIIGLSLILTLFLLSCTKEPSGAVVVAPEAKLESNQIKIPITQVTNQLQKFEYNVNGVKVRYFAVLGSDSQVRTAFDACDVCGGAGYRQQGKDIACNNCGRVFAIDGLGTKNKGYGCWPSYLSHEIKDGDVIIKIAELRQGAFRFTGGN